MMMVVACQNSDFLFSFLFLLLFNLFIHIFKEFFLDFIRVHLESSLNCGFSRKADPESGLFEIFPLKDLEQGAIILLEKDQTIPADILVLDTSDVSDHEAKCYIKCNTIDGSSQITKKLACKLTSLPLNSHQKMFFAEYKKILSGALEFYSRNDIPNPNFRGFLKLKKDPKVEAVGMENMILRGGIVKITKWIIGLVIFTGMNCAIMKGYNPKLKKSNPCEKCLQIYYVIILILLIILALVVFSSSFYHKSLIFYKVSSFLQQGKSSDNKYFYVGSPFGLFIVYSFLFPFEAYILFDIIQLLRKLLIDRYLSKKHSNSIQIYNPEALINLSRIDYIFFNKTGNVTSKNEKISYVFYDDKTYEFPIEKPDKTLITIKPISHDESKNPLLNLSNTLHNNNNNNNETIEINDCDIEFSSEHTPKLETNLLNFQNNSINLKFLESSSHKEDFNDGNYYSFQQKQNNQDQQDHKATLKSGFSSDGPSAMVDSSPKNISDKSDFPNKLDKKIEEIACHHMNSSSHSKTHRSTREHILFDSRLTILEPAFKIFGENEFKNDVYYKLDDNFLKTMVICHKARGLMGKYGLISLPSKEKGELLINENTQSFESELWEDQIILDFCARWGYVFDSIRIDKVLSKIEYIFIENNKKCKFPILAFQDRTPEHPDFSIIYCNENNATILLCRGQKDSMLNKLSLNESEREKLESLLIFFEVKGVIPLIYARKTLNHEQETNYLSQYNNLRSSLINQQEKISVLAEELENKLEFIGVLGIDAPLDIIFAENLNFFQKEIGAKLWLLSGDSSINVFNAARKIGLIGSSMRVFSLDEISETDLILGMKTLLDNLKNLIKIHKKAFSPKHLQNKGSKKKLMDDSKISITEEDDLEQMSLIISGNSLDMIIKNQYLNQNFRFLCSFISSLIGYQLKAHHKAWLAEMVQKSFLKSPRILAIGNGYNDGPMLQQADFGVEIKGFGLGDLRLPDLKHFRTIVRDLAIPYQEKLHNLIDLLAYKSLFFGFQGFFFEFFSNYSGYLFEPSTLLAYSLILLFPSLLIYGFFNETTSFKLLSLKPNTLKQIISIERGSQIKINLGFLAIKAVLHAVITFYLTTYIIRLNVNNEGLNYGLATIEAICVISDVFIVNIEILMGINFKKYPFLYIFTAFLPVITLSGYVLYLYCRASAYYMKGKIYHDFLRDFSILMVLVINILICGLVSWVWEKYVMKIRWNQIDLKKSKKKMVLNLIKLVKRLFRNPKFMDPIIHEMFQTEDSMAQSLNLNIYNLQILDSKLNKKYKLSRKRKSIKFGRIYAFLVFIISFFYLILDFFLQPIVSISFLKIGLIGVGLLFFGLLLTDIFTLFYYRIIITGLVISVSTKIIFDWVFPYHNISLSGALFTLMSTCSLYLNINIIYILIANAFHLLSYLFRLLFLMTSDDLINEDGNFAEDFKKNIDFRGKLTIGISLCIFECSLTSVCYFLSYISEKNKRNEFLNGLKITSEYKKFQDILSILVPRFVQINMNRGVYTMCEEQEQVSILFIDIYNFDEIITSEGNRVVALLDSLYRAYDGFCVSYGVQKIETVGKTYMVASGIKILEIDIPTDQKTISPTLRLIRLAFEMLKYLNQVTFGKGERIKVKIGIHSGNVIAGVIGYHKPQFSLIGDTVNTASRVCSTAEEGKVTVSDESLEIGGRPSLYNYIQRVVAAKGKGDLVTYQVEHLKLENSKFRLKMGKAMESIKKKQNRISFFEKGFGIHQVISCFEKASNSLRSMTSSIIKEEGTIKPSSVFLRDKAKRQSEAMRNGVIRPEEEAKVDIKENEALSNNNINSYIENENNEDSDDDFLEKTFYQGVFKPKGIFLRISNQQNKIYESFLRQMMQGYLKENRILVSVLFFMSLIRTLLLINLVSRYNNVIVIFLLRGVYNALIILPGLKLPLMNSKMITYYKLLVSFVCHLGYFALFFESWLATLPQNISCILLESLLIYVIQTNLYIFTFLEVFGQSIGLIGILYGSFIIKEIYSLEYYLVIMAFMVFNLLKVNFSLRNHIKSFNVMKFDEQKKQEQEKLVSQLIPKHVFEKLKKVMNNHKVDLSDRFDMVTLLFADIAGFTKYSSTVKPSQVVNMLRRLFTEFDRKCVQHQVYKVYTIGDCYVAMGMINASKREPIIEARNIINMGLSMIQIIRQVREEIDFKDLDMRIGVHTGTVIGGIVGTDLVRYDIYGHDVLIANKMESNGITGNIMVSEETKKLLEKDLNANPWKYNLKKQVFLKSLNREIDCFLIETEGVIKEEENCLSMIATNK